MAERRYNFRQLESYLTIAAIADAVLFFIYLICAGSGVIWAKVFLTILCVLISGAILAILYIKKEILRPRALWMTAAAAAIVVCLLFSLILNFPSPKPVATSYQASAVTLLESNQT